MRKTCALLFLSVCFLAMRLEGQTQKRTPTSNAAKPAMTNADVLKMVKAGIASDTIVLAIQNGKTKFDTSADALITLSQNGASKTVIDAMLASSRPDSIAAIAKPITENLNNDFAKASLKALKGIDEESQAGNLDPLHTTVPHETQSLIDDADSNARSEQEKAVVVLLNKLFYLKLAINRNRAVFVQISSGFAPEDVGKVMDTANNIPTTKLMLEREHTCSSALDTVIRSRQFDGTPPECRDALLVDVGR